MTENTSDIFQQLQHENAELKQRVADLEKAVAEQLANVTSGGKKITAQKEVIKHQKEIIDRQKEVIEKLQRMLFGKKSEKIVADNGQMLIPGLLDQLGEPEEKGEEPEKIDVGPHKRNKGEGHHNAGWNGFPDTLPREELIIDVPEKEREGRVFSGFETSERLLHRCEYVVQVVKRKKYVVPGEPLKGVVTAPAPAVPSCLAPSSNRCHYDVSVVVHVIVSKLDYSLPLYRQCAMFSRLGIRVSRSTLCGYFTKVSDALELLFKRMTEKVMACSILHADETSVRMLDEGKAKTCWIWVRKTGIGSPMTVFHFSQDRSKETAHKILGNYTGTILRDGYAAYNDLPAEAAGCWAHCRRKFFDAQDNSPVYAKLALDLIAKLYTLERQAREKAETKEGKERETLLFVERKLLRGESVPIADEYFKLCREIQEKEPPSSSIARAAAYSSSREKELRRFLSDSRLNIDNNPCENVIRPFCLGRKNWLFVGNEKGGSSLAALASFAATCKDNGVDFEKWLLDVLLQLDTLPAEKLDELLPQNWKAKNGAASTPLPLPPHSAQA